MSRSALTRARDLTAIVTEIAELMACGQWVTGRSHHAMAAREGVELSTVRGWATEAGRMLRALSSTEREELQARNAAHLEALAADAHAAGEFGDAVRARAEMAKLLGLNAPERSEVTVKAPAPAQDPRERLEQVIGAIKALEAEADRLRDALAIPVSADVDG